ncbi:MAG: flavodoxin family protein [Nitrospira sp.]|nr:flavodoxin family protein [Nitrospira sp.]
MRALVLNGAIGIDSALSRCETYVVRALESRGAQVDVRRMQEIPVAWCQGCFECWTHTPGICKIDDAGRSIVEAFAKSDVLVCLTPVTFGGYSSELKKALDRSLGVLLPFFKRIDGEVHHPQRYARHVAIGVVATLEHPDAEAETTLRTLVTRNAINFGAAVHAVAVLNGPTDEARESGTCTALIDTLTASLPPTAHLHIDDVDRLLPALPCAEDIAVPPQRALLLVGSAKPRGTSTSEALGHEMLARLAARGLATTTRWVQHDAHSAHGLAALTAAARTHDLLVVATPLYIDTLPSLVTRSLEAIAVNRQSLVSAPPLTVAMIVNCGFPEARHCSVASAIGALFARTTGARWAGALQLGGGGVVGGRPLQEAGSVVKHLPGALDKACAMLADGRAIPPESMAAFRQPLMPTTLYIAAGNAGWLWTTAHERELMKLWRRPYTETP